jgi:hypothetical protein
MQEICPPWAAQNKAVLPALSSCLKKNNETSASVITPKWS